MKNISRWSAFSTKLTLTALGVCALGAAGASLSANNVPILLYGQIGDTAHNEFWVTEDNFRRHMQGLQDRGYTTVTLEQYLAIKQGTMASPPEKPILLTFTNGYANLQSIVDPVLAQYGFNAAAMILPGRVGGDSSWDTGDIEAGAPVVQHLTWNQLNQLRQTGRWSFGSHTNTHTSLVPRPGSADPVLTDAQLTQEIAGSKQTIESELGVNVRAFSYPYGRHNADIRQRVQAAGYEMAFGVRNDVSHDNIYALPRFDIDNTVTVAALFGPQYLNDAGTQNYHPADSNQDWRITVGEVSAYAAQWRAGNAPLGNVTRAAFLWRSGGHYTYDPQGSGATAWVPANGTN